MTLTASVLAVGLFIGWTLVLHGLISIAEGTNGLAICRLCVALGGVEIIGGTVMWIGLIAMAGGFLG